MLNTVTCYHFVKILTFIKGAEYLLQYKFKLTEYELRNITVDIYKVKIFSTRGSCTIGDYLTHNNETRYLKIATDR